MSSVDCVAQSSILHVYCGLCCSILNYMSTIGYHTNYSGRWLVATMSASKSTSLMRDFTSLAEFDLMFMLAVKSYLHSWCGLCCSILNITCLVWIVLLNPQ